VTDAEAGAKRHVLLIEDDAPTGRFVSLVLAARFRVTTCRDGEAALAVLREDPVDVVLIDIALPSVAAAQLSVLSEVRIPVIVLTDMNDEAALVECLQAGAFDLALKPISPEDLETSVALAAGVEVGGVSGQPALKSNLLDIDFAALQATKAGVRQLLSLSEWRFLEALASRLGQTVLYQEIMRQVHGPGYREYPRLAQAWAARLSKKVGVAEFLGLGYALVV
jgi:two-component system KDP operon response regulator KdpE